MYCQHFLGKKSNISSQTNISILPKSGFHLLNLKLKYYLNLNYLTIAIKINRTKNINWIKKSSL